jgi:hypothetical protein
MEVSGHLETSIALTSEVKQPVLIIQGAKWVTGLF